MTSSGILGETITVNAFLLMAANWKMYKIFVDEKRRH